MTRLLAWLFPCPDEACMLHRWHRNAHYCKWDNGVWQLWTDELDFGAHLPPNVSDKEAVAFMETFVPIAQPNRNTEKWSVQEGQ